MRGQSQYILLLLLVILIGGSAAMGAVVHRDQGLALLDAGRIDAAADHFYSSLRRSPNRLDLLDCCLRVEQRRVHGDSVVGRISQRLQSRIFTGADEPVGAQLGRRFLLAEALRRDGQYAAAADSFQRLTLICGQNGDSLSALAACMKTARCRIDGENSTSILESRQELQNWLPWAANSTRLQTEIKILLANLHYKVDELDQAERLYESILMTVDTHWFWTHQSEVLNALGCIKSKRRHLVEALYYYEQAVTSARNLGERRRLCLLLTNLGYQETHLRDFESAQAHLMEAQSLARAGGYRKYLGAIQSGLGAVAEMSGDRVEAVKRFKEAVLLSQKGDNFQVEVGARQRLAYNLALMGEYGEARAQYETCLEMLDRSGGQFILNWVLAGLALANHKLGYLDLAVGYYQRAHQVNLAMDDRMSAAWCQNSLGKIHSLRGDYRQALLAHHKALEQYEEIGDKEGLGEAHASMAHVFLKLGDYAEALQHCRLALDLARESNSQELLRGVSHTMATVYSATGQDGLAEQNYLRVIKIAREWSDLVGEIWALNDLASHFLALDRRKEAQDLLQTAWSMLKEEKYYHVRSKTSLLLGRASDSPPEALEWAEQALKLARTGGLPEQEWAALSDLGQYHFLLGEHNVAEDRFLDAMELVESLRRRAGSDELRRHMLHPALKPYEGLIRLQMVGEENPGAAFATSERFRAQILAGRLYAATAWGSEQVIRATEPEERDLAASITHLQSRLQEGALSASQRDSLRRRVGLMEDDFALLKLRWTAGQEIENNILYPEPMATPQLQAVLAPGEHALSYFLGEDRSFLFSVNRDRIKAYELPPRSELEEIIQRFLRLLKYQGSQDQRLPEEVILEARQELYRLLLAPAEDDFDTGATLVMVADGLLHRLPFAYLHDGQKYVLEKNELFMTPSIRILGYLRQRAAEYQGALAQHHTEVLTVGCAGTGSDDAGESVRVHLFTGEPVTRLPHADEEAWRLAERFHDAVILTGRAATERKLRSGVLKSPDIVHIAAHSYADEEDVRRSYIVLNRPGESDPVGGGESGFAGGNDGLLQWREIVSLEMTASLVALASCRSAGGVLSTGEGITGLTQAFLLAGSSCVLATLTHVPDQGSNWVMDRFYDHLQNGSSVAAALRSAQLAGLSQGTGGIYPQLGTGFVAVGDGAQIPCGRSALSIDSGRILWLRILILAGIFLAIFQLRRQR